MSEKSLYSEVKARKLAGAKKNIVKAVEKHGKILGIKGKYEKPDKVIKFCYASVKDVIRPSDVPKTDLNKYDMVLVGCPGSEIPKIGISKFREYVIENGGWLYTTDWCLRTVIENAFPGYMHWDGTKTGDVVVPCHMTDAHHPFLDGVYAAIMSGKYEGSSPSKGPKGPKGPKGYGKTPTFSWWLEDKSFPITIDRPEAVHVLIRSEEIGRKWGNDPVLCYFDVGKMGGRVIHQISHTHLQKGGGKGKFVSAMILTNILDEKVGLKHGIKKGSGGPNYQDYGGSAPQSAIDWGGSVPQTQNDYVTPSVGPNDQASSALTPELTGTAQVIEVTDKGSIPPNQKCALGDGNFKEFEGRVFKCSGCGTLYHEQCLNVQLQNGICKICERIFLY